jgi:oligopeptide transport system permease protein
MFMAIPGFVLCSIILILGPHIGLQTSFLESSIFGLNNYLKSIIAPILVLTITSLSGFTYYTRNEIKSILNSDYILNARSKGLTS